MLAEQHLRSGDLDQALAELKATVGQNPADAKYRIFLFQILSVCGNWQSALDQLEIAGDLDPGALAMVQAYREAIRCEQSRQSVWAGELSPLIFGEPERWLALMIEALKLDASGAHDDAANLRQEAFDTAPATSGSITVADGHTNEFEWLADADPRMGPVLEVFMNGQYYWVPVNRIARMDFEAPADLRDFVWTPVHFMWSNGGEAYGMIPTRYPGSHSDADSAIRLSRKTDWMSYGDQAEVFYGIGQRMIATDAAEYALLDIRDVTLNVESSETQFDSADDDSVVQN